MFIAALFAVVALTLGVRASAADTSATFRGTPQLSVNDERTSSADLDVAAFLGDASSHDRIALPGGDRFFRVECGFSHFAYDDPFALPDQPGRAPLQMFFGNTGADAATKYWSAIDSGGSTCSGGPLDRSVYAMPAVFDDRQRAVVPSYFIVHYNTFGGTNGSVDAQVQPFPPGLEITSGNRWAGAPQDASSPLRQIEMSCDVGERGDNDLSVSQAATFPYCDPGELGGSSSVKVQVRFPSCWDGVSLTSPDQHHMTFPLESFHASACPSTHPVLLPSIEYNVFFDVPKGADTSAWYLSTDVSTAGGQEVQGGTTMHASWLGAWHRGVLDTWVSGCSNVAGARCAQGILGAGDSAMALRRLEPHFGPYDPWVAVEAKDLRGLCPFGGTDTTAARCEVTGQSATGPSTPASAASVASVAPPAPERASEAETTPVAPRPAGAAAPRGLKYDTAWEMPYKASNDEILAYLDHLDAAGFDGTWISLLPFGAAYATVPPGRSDQVAYLRNGTVELSDDYAQRVSWILEQADWRNLRVAVVVAWARANTCNNPNVTDQNGAGFAAALATRWASAPALDYWVLGGDVSEAECGSRLLATSRELARGLRDGGASQPIAFHTGAGSENYLAFNNEPWLDVQAVQTGHCQSASTMEAKLSAVVAASAKPVILAESRYYRLAPPWRGCLHNPSNPVGPQAVADDVAAAVRSGVVGQIFGDARRYSWCDNRAGLFRPDDNCSQGIWSTFDTPGEQAFLAHSHVG